MPQAQQLGRYHLLDRIAFGGMAEIFRAKTFDGAGQAHLVAVKRVLAHLVEDQDFLQMLVDEAKISALLRHENIARLYEFARAGDEYFLAMEYVDGKDLRSLLEKARQTQELLPEEHVAWIGMEVARALHAAHTQRDKDDRPLRIVHRDVSPSNVLCSYHGEVKLCDFGIAKATLTRVQTKTGVIKGKVKYMSPEQAMGRKLDHRSDLFSLGTVMYEMLTLQAPFQAPTEIELIFAVRDARKTPIQELTPDVPDEMARIVDKAMTRSRAARYQSGEDLALDLRIFLDRHAPGYRRSHFSRYMRKVFEEEIERELRQLEAFEISGGDVAQVGENLIAEALGPDAPFTKFSPMHASSTALTSIGTSNFPHLEPRQPTDLHVQPTMMLDRAKLGLAPVEPAPTDLHAEQTRILSPAPGSEAKKSLHEQETGEKELPTTEGYKGVAGELHELETHIIFNPLQEAAPTVPYDRHETERQPRVEPEAEVETAESPEIVDPTPLPRPVAASDYAAPGETAPTTPRADAFVPPAKEPEPVHTPIHTGEPLPSLATASVVDRPPTSPTAFDRPSTVSEESFDQPPTQPTQPTAPRGDAFAKPSDFAVSPPTLPTDPRQPAVEPAPAAAAKPAPDEFDKLKDTGEEQTSVPLADDDLEPIN